MLTLDFPDPEMQAAALVFAARFQQTTGPVMAKALEDTVFYRYNRLIALNEVGGEPGRTGASIETFHRAMTARLKEQPLVIRAVLVERHLMRPAAGKARRGSDVVDRG